MMNGEDVKFFLSKFCLYIFSYKNSAGRKELYLCSPRRIL